MLNYLTIFWVRAVPNFPFQGGKLAPKQIFVKIIILNSVLHAFALLILNYLT